MSIFKNVSRREFIKMAGGVGAGLCLPFSVSGEGSVVLPKVEKPIPKTGEKISVIGMGTSRTFDANGDKELIKRLQRVTQTFFDMGGNMIDSSPMYGSAEQVIGQLLPDINITDKQLFSATKVWIEGKQEGIEQMEQSRKKWGVKNFDLMQIHNLVDWETHYKTLQQMKADGEIRYIGITTSHGRYHDQLKDILSRHDFDFVQLSYNIANRDVESPLLSIAKDKGVSVIVNRAYQRGDLFRKVRGKALPAWASEFDCTSWGQFFLKFVVSHPAVTCAIPATTKVKHMQDNMLAGRGRMPSAKERVRMIRYFEGL